MKRHVKPDALLFYFIFTLKKKLKGFLPPLSFVIILTESKHFLQLTGTSARFIATLLYAHPPSNHGNRHTQHRLYLNTDKTIKNVGNNYMLLL